MDLDSTKWHHYKEFQPLRQFLQHTLVVLTHRTGCGDVTSTRPAYWLEALFPTLFLGCTAPVTLAINKSCAGKHEMHRHMGLLARFQSGEWQRDEVCGRESYSPKLFTALSLVLCPGLSVSPSSRVAKLCVVKSDYRDLPVTSCAYISPKNIGNLK